MIPKWSEVNDPESVEHLLDLTRGFHDSVTTEARWIGAEFINQEGALVLRGYGELGLLIESQFHDVESVELRFKGVRRFVYDYERDPKPDIQFDANTVFARIGTWEILADTLEYCQRSPPFQKEYPA